MEFKDIVAVVTGLIGSITGIAALLHSKNLSKQVVKEPYFKNKWREHHKDFELYVSSFNWVCNQAKESCLKKELTEISYYRISKISTIDTVNWSYAPKLLKSVREIESRIDRFVRLLSENNDLFDLVSGKTIQNMQVCELADYYHSKKEEEEPQGIAEREKQKEFHREYAGRAKALVNKYCSNGDMAIGSLKKNPGFLIDVANKKNEIKSLALKILIELKKMEVEIDFYNTKFITDE